MKSVRLPMCCIALALLQLLVLQPALAQESLDAPTSLGQLVDRLAAAPPPSWNVHHELLLETWEKRSQAVLELSRLGTNAWPALPSLIGLAGHPNLQIAVGAATVLGRIEAARHPQWSSLKSALYGSTNAARAFQFIAAGRPEFTREYSLEERRFGLMRLGDIGPAAAEAAPALVEFLRAKSEAERELWIPIVMALKRIAINSNEFGPILIQRFCDPDESIDNRVAAARALAILDPEGDELRPLFRTQLQDSHSQVRLAAASVLLGWKAPAEEILPVLAPLLHHKLRSIRAATLQTLAEAGPAASKLRPAIEELLNDSSLPVRASAASALEKIGPFPSSAQPGTGKTVP